MMSPNIMLALRLPIGLLVIANYTISVFIGFIALNIMRLLIGYIALNIISLLTLVCKLGLLLFTA